MVSWRYIEVIYFNDFNLGVSHQDRVPPSQSNPHRWFANRPLQHFSCLSFLPFLAIAIYYFIDNILCSITFAILIAFLANITVLLPIASLTILLFLPPALIVISFSCQSCQTAIVQSGTRSLQLNQMILSPWCWNRSLWRQCNDRTFQISDAGFAIKTYCDRIRKTPHIRQRWPWKWQTVGVSMIPHWHWMLVRWLRGGDHRRKTTSPEPFFAVATYHTLIQL